MFAGAWAPPAGKGFGVLPAPALDRGRIAAHRCSVAMRPRPSDRSSRYRAPTTARALPPWVRRLVQVARLLVVACALQLSGGAHVLVDLIGSTAIACIDTCDRSDEGDADEHGCPPGCPDCSCPHGRLPSLPPEIAASVPVQLAWALLPPWTPYRSGAPPSPPISSLERPPRA